MPKSVATWYGPASSATAPPAARGCAAKTIGVAHRQLPCGTKVTLKYRGRYVRARVIDRGPYTSGARWDLTQRSGPKAAPDGTADKIRAAPIR